MWAGKPAFSSLGLRSLCHKHWPCFLCSCDLSDDWIRAQVLLQKLTFDLRSKGNQWKLQSLFFYYRLLFGKFLRGPKVSVSCGWTNQTIAVCAADIMKIFSIAVWKNYFQFLFTNKNDLHIPKLSAMSNVKRKAFCSCTSRFFPVLGPNISSVSFSCWKTAALCLNSGRYAAGKPFPLILHLLNHLDHFDQLLQNAYKETHIKIQSCCFFYRCF